PYVDSWGDGLGIDHQAMVRALREQVGQRRNVSLQQGVPVTGVVEQDGRVCGVKLRSGEVVHARLVVAADGRQSRIRKSLGLEPLRAGMLESVEQDPFEGCATHALYTQACAVPGAVLIGDAGGCSHPLTATGMTAAMHDVLVLADALGKHGICDGALMSYQRR